MTAKTFEPEAVVDAMAPLLGWTADETKAQVAHCRGLRAQALAATRETLPA